MEKRVLVITGASSGIGEALAYEAAGRGYNLALCARNTDKLKPVADRCKTMGADVLTLKADVSIENDCKLFIDAVLQHFNRIDVLINNAGITMRALFNDVDLDVIRQVMDINFWGTVYCTKYALPAVMKQNGSIVGVSSIAGYKGLPARTGYSASKFAMHGFLEALRIENLKNNLHVLIACPGYTASNIRNTALSKDGSSQQETPLDESKLMQPETVAKAIFKAIDKREPRLVLTTQGKLTVLLSKFFPKLLDKLVYNTVAKEPGSPFK